MSARSGERVEAVRVSRRQKQSLVTCLSLVVLIFRPWEDVVADRKWQWSVNPCACSDTDNRSVFSMLPDRPPEVDA
eukprot:4031646-Amphidinium_carterae.1